MAPAPDCFEDTGNFFEADVVRDTARKGPGRIAPAFFLRCWKQPLTLTLSRVGQGEEEWPTLRTIFCRLWRYRLPKMAEPTRTPVAPKAIASS